MFNEQKFKTAIQTCNFNRLQKLEEKKGFDEAVTKKGSSDKIKFFNLGNKNNYKNILGQEMINEMNLYYKEELKKYRYN